MEGLKEGKEKAISLALSQIERQFGKGAIMRLGAEPSALDVSVISTGSISLVGGGLVFRDETLNLQACIRFF